MDVFSFECLKGERLLIKMDIDLIPDARDYEKYFYTMAEGVKTTRSKTSINEITGAFDRPAIPVDTLRVFNPALYENQYEKWYASLQHFSLLFYGLGSKMQLLQHFSQTYLGNFGYVVEADVFSGQQRLFNSILIALCEISLTDTRSLSALIGTLKSRNFHAFIILHSIDNEILNDPEFQNGLIECANSGCIHIVCSIDRTPLFSLKFMSGMKFYPIMVETNQFYTQEIGYSNSNKGSASLDSIERFSGVLKTLTEIANGIFLILLKHQIQTGEGLSKNEWTDMSATTLCVKMKSIFPSAIAEFLDHKLIIEKKKENLFAIPLQPIQLQALLKKLEAVPHNE